jgi:HK97 family phage prohead protease
MRTKSSPALVKAAGVADGLAPGEFMAIVSVFGNPDGIGDIVVPGAYVDDIKEWTDSGDPMPVIWSHDWSDPESHIGALKGWREMWPGDPELPEKLKANGGLWVHGQNDVGDNARADRVSKLLAGRRVKQFSFAYDEIDSGWGKHNGVEGWLLRKLHVFEVGPTLVGMNQMTDLLAAKRLVVDVSNLWRERSKAGGRQPADVADTLAEIKAALAEFDTLVPDEAGAVQDSTTGRPGDAGSQDTDGRKADGVDEQAGDSTPVADALSNLATAETLLALASLDTIG